LLRPKGRLAIVDFKAESPSGPPAQYRIPPEKVTEELNAAGFSLVETYESSIGPTGLQAAHSCLP
jgi:hypothetical protein